MKDNSFIVIETTVLLSTNWQCHISQFEVVYIIKNKLRALYHVINVIFLPISLRLLLLLLIVLFSDPSWH